MGTTTDGEQVISGVMDRWKAGVDAHEPDQVAACFTEDAIFEGWCSATSALTSPTPTGRPSGSA